MKKHFLITGGSSGIGFELAKISASHGYNVSIFSRRKKLIGKIQRENTLINGFVSDVSKKRKIQEQIKKAISINGFPDIVVLNAGIYKPIDTKKIDCNDFKVHFEINYLGVINCLETLVPIMVRNKKGHIVIMGSVAGYRGLPKSAAYGPTKAALQNLAECLYFDMYKVGIKVQIINPGFVETQATSINDFKMPDLISASKAGELIFDGLKSSKFEISFPKSFVNKMKFLKLLPHSVYFKLVGKSTGYL